MQSILVFQTYLHLFKIYFDAILNEVIDLNGSQINLESNIFIFIYNKNNKYILKCDLIILSETTDEYLNFKKLVYMNFVMNIKKSKKF